MKNQEIKNKIIAFKRQDINIKLYTGELITVRWSKTQQLQDDCIIFKQISGLTESVISLNKIADVLLVDINLQNLN